VWGVLTAGGGCLFFGILLYSGISYARRVHRERATAPFTLGAAGAPRVIYVQAPTTMMAPGTTTAAATTTTTTGVATPSVIVLR
jgi:hypothetical protein